MKRIFLFSMLFVSSLLMNAPAAIGQVAKTSSAGATRPASPTGLTVDVSQSTSTTLLLRWNDNSTDEVGFEITVDYRYTIIVPANTTSWTVRGLNPAQNYNFYIHSYKMDGTTMLRSLYQSGPVIVQTLKSNPIPPGNIRTGVVCANSVELLWTDSDNEESYAIERAYDSPANFGQIDLRFANTDFFVDTKVEPGRLVYYRVKAINNGGKTFTFSSPVAAYTKQFSPALPPHNIFVTDKSFGSISIQWQNGVEDQVCKLDARREVRIWVSEDNGSIEFPVDLAAMLPADNFRYTIEGLKPGTKYKISVQSMGFSNGDSYKTLPIVVTTLGPAPAPTNLVLNTGVNVADNPFIGLIWKDNSEDEDAFGVEVSTDQNFWILADKIAPNVNYFVHMPVDEGVTYYYKVFTYNQYGESARSNVASAMVDYTKAPNAPYDLKGKVDGGKAMLTWKDDSSREEMFEVERSDDGTTFAKVGTASRNKGMFTDTTVASGKSYHYQVRAINPKGNSGYTNKVSLTLPNASTSSILTEAEVAVFPNPTANSIVVTLPEAMRNEAGVVTIYDQNNRVMNSAQFAKGEVEKSFNLSTMPQGMYLITISTETTKTSKKVFKN